MLGRDQDGDTEPPTDSDTEPPTDGEQFDAVGRFEEPAPAETDGERQFDLSVPDPTPADGDVHPRIRFHFWRLLLVFNVALLGLTLGPVLVVFDGNRSLGVPAFAGGLLLFAYGLYRYRDAKAEIEAIVDGDGEEMRGDGDTDETRDDGDDARRSTS